MASEYIIGIDEGTQSAKITIYDFFGNIIMSESEPLSSMHLASGGVVEHPDDDLWSKICTASKRLMLKFNEEFGSDANRRIVGVGLCSIRFCRCLLNGEGRLAQPAMSWMDDRVSRYHESTNPEVKYVTTASGYITHRLTGECRDTAANYLGIWPVDLDSYQYLGDDKLSEFNLEREMLFELQMPGTIVGYVTAGASGETGFTQGLPVVATANDKAVEALGTGCIDVDTAVISLGTYIAAMTPGDTNIQNSENLWTNLASLPNRYLYESGGIRRGMWLLSWWTKIIGDEYKERAEALGMSAEAMLDAEAEKIPTGSDGLLVVPNWLAPVDKPYRKGIILGFDGRHTRAHIFRALMEAIALTIKNKFDKMCIELDRDIKKIIISGGGAKSAPFMQIFADVFNRPVERSGVSGAAGLGAAVCVAVATGVYPSYEHAVNAMVKKGEVFIPNSEAAGVYNRINLEIYQKLDGIGDDILQKVFEIFG